MGLNIKESLKTIWCMDMEYILIRMLTKFMKVKCMKINFVAKVLWYGKMVENIKVSLTMRKERVLVYIGGVMGESMKDNGKTTNNMEREFILIKSKKESKDSGLMEKEYLKKISAEI